MKENAAPGNEGKSGVVKRALNCSMISFELRFNSLYRVFWHASHPGAMNFTKAYNLACAGGGVVGASHDFDVWVGS
jgi:hypothetical protein